MKVVRLALMAALPVVLLAGCQKNPLKITRTLCPAHAVAKSAGTMTLFSPPESRNADAMVASAAITGLTNNCTEGADPVASNLRITIGAQRPAAGSEQTVTLPYFVAVVKGGNQLISKQVYQATVRFPAGQLRAETVETVRANIDRAAALAALPPKPDKKRRDENPEDVFMDAAPKAASFEVLVGFQLADSDVLYNITR
ncbi:hypothetical protein [Parapedomonas caeni]